MSLALNMAAPPPQEAWLATLADQRLRYAALVLGALLCFGGLAIVATRLREAGQSVVAALGFASSIVATVIFTLLFLAYPHLATSRYEQELVAGTPPTWWTAFAAFLSSAGLVHRLCAHLSTILFALALHQSRGVNRVASLSVSGLALMAAVIGTFIHLPPAVTFIPPYLLGVALLQGNPDPAT